MSIPTFPPAVRALLSLCLSRDDETLDHLLDVEQLQKVDESSSDDSYAVDDTPTFTPNILWWTKSRYDITTTAVFCHPPFQTVPH